MIRGTAENVKNAGVIFMKINIDYSRQYQTFEGFGVSGAWWAQLVGGRNNRDVISKLLFDSKEGIALTAYRYNIGAGSKDSGNGNIDNPLRRTESFLTDNGEYDFSKDANAVYMMKQAVRDGAKEIVLFVNSPPEQMTKNGKSHLDPKNAFRTNLDRKNYPAFVKYCLDVTEHFVSEGLPVKYLSPVNEPVWIWTGGQEGCHYSPRQAGSLMKLFAEELEKRPALRDIKLAGVEAGDIRWFNKSYTRELLRYPQTRKRLDGVDLHSYFLHVPLPFLNNRPAFLKRFRRYMDRHYPDMPVRMSEWCHMQGGRDSSMSSALVMAKVMWEDINLLAVSSWQHWIALSEVDYCDGLIYINLDDESYEITKRYYVTGNFSKYIPYGARRVYADCADSELLITAFTKDKKTVLTVINGTEHRKKIELPARSLFVVTDETRSLEEYENVSEAEIAPRSVNTFVFAEGEDEK